MSQRIVAFCCENSAWKAAESMTDAAVLDAVEMVRLPCSGKVEVGLVLRCLEQGAPGVLVLGCPTGNCTYLKGNVRAGLRVGQVKKALRDAGLSEDRVTIAYVSSLDAHRVERAVKDMQARLAAAGTPGASRERVATAPGGGTRSEG